MKKLLQFLLISLAITTTSSAQVIFQDSIANAASRSIIGTTDNGFLVSGYSNQYSSSPNISAAYFVKLNNTGGVEWTRSVGLRDTNCYLQTLTATSTGFVAAAIGDGFILLIQLDKQGNVVTTKKLEQINRLSCTRMITTNDGGYAITGNVLNNGSWGVLFIKLDKDLNVQGAESINVNGNDGYEIANSIIQTSDGSYVFTGSYDNEFTDILGEVLTIKTKFER